MLWPGVTARSMLSTTLTPSRSMSKIRCPTSSVPVLLLAMYRRTWIWVPAGTGNVHSISEPVAASQRSVLNRPAGGRSKSVFGTVESVIAAVRV